MGAIVIKVGRPGKLDSYFPASQKAAPAFDVDDVTGRNGNVARPQFQNLTSRFIPYRDHPDLRPACRANKHIQADIGDYS
jgi:hypothetical protein